MVFQVEANAGLPNLLRSTIGKTNLLIVVFHHPDNVLEICGGQAVCCHYGPHLAVFPPQLFSLWVPQNRNPLVTSPRWAQPSARQWLKHKSRQ